MYVLACIPIYGDRWRDLCSDPAGSQESAPELRLGCNLASRTRRVALRPLTDSGTNHHPPGFGRSVFVCQPPSATNGEANGTSMSKSYYNIIVVQIGEPQPPIEAVPLRVLESA